MKLIILFEAIMMASAVNVANLSTSTTEISAHKGGIATREFCKSVGNKYFCVDATPRTWKQASDYCKTTGKELASFEALADATGLNDINDLADLKNYANYWTSGRDSRVLGQFVWDKGDAMILPALDPLYFQLYDFDYQTCLIFRKRKRGGPLLVAAPCTSKCYTLCQSG